MKAIVKGFEIITGKAKATGKDYDMSRLHADIPLQESATASRFVVDGMLKQHQEASTPTLIIQVSIDGL